MKKVFVYGTLMSGFSNNHLLRDAEYLGERETLPELTMYSLGGFPGLRLEGETPIKGELYLVDEDTEESLDCLEGVHPREPERGLYSKSYITLNSGEDDVLVYIVNERYADPGRVVKSGNWKDVKKIYRYG